VGGSGEEGDETKEDGEAEGGGDAHPVNLERKRKRGKRRHDAA
jgi:hypothetical protein